MSRAPEGYHALYMFGHTGPVAFEAPDGSLISLLEDRETMGKNQMDTDIARKLLGVKEDLAEQFSCLRPEDTYWGLVATSRGRPHLKYEAGDSSHLDEFVVLKEHPSEDHEFTIVVRFDNEDMPAPKAETDDPCKPFEHALAGYVARVENNYIDARDEFEDAVARVEHEDLDLKLMEGA